MESRNAAEKCELILGVEGGATKTEWVLFSHDKSHDVWTLVQEGVLPKANFKLLSKSDLVELLERLPKDASKVGVYLAGVVSEDDHQNLREVVQTVWPSVAQISCGNDRQSGFAASFGSLQRSGIMVISGTGSSVTGCDEFGRIISAGGKGHILGDQGSAYSVAIDALRLIMKRYDKGNVDGALTRAILTELKCTGVAELVDWTQKADKSSIARLTKTVFDVYNVTEDDDLVRILKTGTESLVEFVGVVVERLKVVNPKLSLRGSMFTEQPIYVKMFEEAIDRLVPKISVSVSCVSGAFGAARLAANCDPPILKSTLNFRIDRNNNCRLSEMDNAWTEQRCDRSLNIDKMSSLELVDLFAEEEVYVQKAVQKSRHQLCQAVDTVTKALANGGRLFYVGSGTSGRLGVLDASEIPPTFGEPPTTVQGIISGGVRALYRSVEGAEDESSEGSTAIRSREVTSRDVVCGISACGRTPFVLGALDEAKSIGSNTIFITCNPSRARQDVYQVEIVLETGAELVTGSTRLKAGTATKVALNIISTCSMIRLGKVQSNLMISMKATNTKLRDRAVRLVTTVKGCSYDEALQMLTSGNWDLTSIIRQS